jgi:hypothetical protein
VVDHYEKAIVEVRLHVHSWGALNR